MTGARSIDSRARRAFLFSRQPRRIQRKARTSSCGGIRQDQREYGKR